MAAWEFQTLQNIAEKHDWHKFISMQNYYNLIYREEENEMIPYCNDTGVGLIPWSPIARGALARPWGDRSTQREKSDEFLHMLVRSREDKVDEEIVNRLEEVSKRVGKSMAQCATAWCLGKKDVYPIIDKCSPSLCISPCLSWLTVAARLSSTQRIDEAVEACKFKLSPEDIKYLEEPYLPKKRQGY